MVDQSLIVAADLSFRAPGVVALGRNSSLYYFRVPSPTPSLKRFGDVFKASREMAVDVAWMKDLPYGDDTSKHYVFEEPPPRSIFSSGLYVLNTACLESFYSPPSWSCHSCSALLVKSALGSRNATKNDAIELVSRLLMTLPVTKFYEVRAKTPREAAKNEAIQDMLVHDGLCEAFIILCAFCLNRGDDVTGTFRALTNGKKFNFMDIK